MKRLLVPSKAALAISLVCLILSLFGSSQILRAETAEPEPTPIIEAPPAPPLAVSPPAYDDVELEEESRPLLLLVLIIVVASGIALAVGFYAYRKIRMFLAKRKEKKKAKADEA